MTKVAAATKAVIQTSVIHHRRRGAEDLPEMSLTRGSADMRLRGVATGRWKKWSVPVRTPSYPVAERFGSSVASSCRKESRHLVEKVPAGVMHGLLDTLAELSKLKNPAAAHARVHAGFLHPGTILGRGLDGERRWRHAP